MTTIELIERVSAIASLVFIPISVGITLAVVRYQEKKQAANKQLEIQKEEENEAAIRKKKERSRATSSHWGASKRLLEVALFRGMPSSVESESIEKLLEYFEEHEAVGRSESLFRASRLFVENRIFRAPQNPKPEPVTAESINQALVKRDPLDDVLVWLKTPPMWNFATCFQLEKIDAPEANPRASTYFEALKDVVEGDVVEGKEGYSGIPDGERWRSLSSVTVQDGFVAPTYLIGGLLNEFEDNWPVLLGGFGNSVTGADAFIRVQRFEFYCWLLWGPSIPACTCNAWDGSFVALQYGYGDENNSFPLVLADELYHNGWEAIRRVIASVATGVGTKPNGIRPAPMAVGEKVVGTIAWGPRFNAGTGKIPRIYFVDGKLAFEGLMLRAQKIEQIAEKSLYYSAYAWIMFEACTETAEGAMLARYVSPDDHTPDDRWKYLLPIFEHANIADGIALEFLKKRLAEKAWQTIAELERSSKIRFRYVCAIDDPGSVETEDGVHELRFQLDEGQRPERLRELLEKTILASEGPVQAADTCRRLFRSRPPMESRQIITSCDLPEIVAGCFHSARNAHP